MKLHEIKNLDGSITKGYRKGRGIGSGNGKTAGVGHKGQNSRSGGGVRPGFEGNQNPIYRRLPKRGFKNYCALEFGIVNVETLNRFEDGTIVTPTLLVDAGLVKKEYNGIKVLGKGDLTKKLTVHAHKFSKTASEAISKAGGVVEVIK